jgi:hypothetical protein
VDRRLGEGTGGRDAARDTWNAANENAADYSELLEAGNITSTLIDWVEGGVPVVGDEIETFDNNNEIRQGVIIYIKDRIVKIQLEAQDVD